MTVRAPLASNWLDRIVAAVAPQRGVRRVVARSRFRALTTGYESAEPSRRRRFAWNGQSANALVNGAAVPLREQARHLERNHDVAKGALDRLVDFMAGPNGIQIEPAPKRRDGTIHEEFAAHLARRWKRWCEWPEVTWTHDWGATCRMVARSWLRDGDCFAQLITGARPAGTYSDDIPVSLELLEADMVPSTYNDVANNLVQGIERNAWGRPIAYWVYRQHPGDGLVTTAQDLKRVPEERILHVRLVQRIHQLRGISVMASVIARLQDIYEYEDAERIAAKMGASMVLKMTHGTPDMWAESSTYDPKAPPIMQTDAGMVVVSTQPGEDAEFFDTKRPNVNAEPFVEAQLRRAAAGFGLGYSSLSRNYNGTYSAQRQELVENRPHFEAGTMVLVAQFARPVYQTFVDAAAIIDGVPRDVDLASIHDAEFMGPPLLWIDPQKETAAALMQTQAGFRSSASVIRERGGSLRDTYAQIEHEQRMRLQLGIRSTVDGTPVAAPGEDATDPAPRSRVVPMRGNR